MCGGYMDRCREGGGVGKMDSNRKQIIADLRRIREEQGCSEVEAAVILLMEDMDDYFDSRTIGERTFTGEMRRRRAERKETKTE